MKPDNDAFRFCLILLLFALPQALCAQSQTIQDQTDEIQQLVDNLGADTFAARQEAMRDLIRVGIDAIEPLKDAIMQGEPETRMRAVSVIGRLAVDRDRECQRQAQDLLAELTQSEDRDIRSLASQTISRLGETMMERALNDLKGLGADIDVTQYNDGTRVVRSFEITIAPDFRGQESDYSMLTWLDGQMSLVLLGEQINNQVIREIASIKSLYSLIIKRGTLDNDAMKTIAGFDQLRILHLYYVNIDDKGMDVLADMTGLNTLRLFGTRVTKSRGEWAQRTMEATDVDWRNGAFLGIYFNDDTGPCIVSNVVRDSAADRSGFKAGDQVIRFADLKIETGQQFLRGVAEYFPGDKVKAMVIRGQEEIELEFELGRFPDVEEFKDE